MFAARSVPLTAILVLDLAAAATAPNSLSQREAAEGWALLWDGKTLAGWEPHGGADWNIANGVLVAESGESGWLGTTATFADFMLKAEFRTAADGNSGIFLRSAREGQPHLTGYELQIFDNQPAGYNTGSLVGSIKAPPAKIIPGQWNRFEVTAQGDHFIVIYNGRKVLDAHDAKSSRGVIGLQYNKGKKIEFRNLKIRQIK